MLIGNESINEKFFEGWNYDDFEKFIKQTNIEKGTGLTIPKLAKRLGIELPKKPKEL